MTSPESAWALYCEDVAVRFPLLPPGKRWQLLLGRRVRDWHPALDGVNLHVPRGKIVGVIGRNGAGKSTLLRTLAGVYPLARGRVVRLGPVSALFELGGMGGWLITGRQYIRRWLRLNAVPKRQWPGLIEEIQEFSELGDRLDDRIFTYSAGMAARLYFATATSVMNDIYLIDEVLSVGDEHFQGKCWKRVRDRMAHGVSGVLVTHDWSAVLRLCEHTCQLADGRVVAAGNSETIICDYLQLADQLDPAAHARFAPDTPVAAQAVSGAEWVFDAPVNLTGSGPVLFSYSVEKLVLGLDWQILFMGRETEIASEPGRHKARIRVPAMPLPAGTYRLNLFLAGPKLAGGGGRRGFDIRSWTTGNSLLLTVEGAQAPGLVSLPCVEDVQ